MTKIYLHIIRIKITKNIYCNNICNEWKNKNGHFYHKKYYITGSRMMVVCHTVYLNNFTRMFYSLKKWSQLVTWLVIKKIHVGTFWYCIFALFFRIIHWVYFFIQQLYNKNFQFGSSNIKYLLYSKHTVQMLVSPKRPCQIFLMRLICFACPMLELWPKQ